MKYDEIIISIIRVPPQQIILRGLNREFCSKSIQLVKMGRER